MACELPIDPHLPAIVDEARRRRAVVLVAEPGAGKTTRVPPALYERWLSSSTSSEVVVVEPRRLAARLAAHRVASEIGVDVGGLVGYQVRFEDRTSAQTKIRFVTDGVMLRQLLSRRSMEGVGAVILDEFHERHLQADLSLAIVRHLQRSKRRDLAILVMSATIEAEAVARYLDAEVINVAGRQHPVEIEHDDRPDERRLEVRVSNALKRLKRRGLAGDVLVFLPGAAEIRRSLETCSEWSEHQGVELAPLHGDQPLAEQAAVLSPSARPKVILSTNVAETSITIEGVTAVVDSGLAREARHSPWSGLPSLQTVPISKASATQRAGRSGRTGPGLCMRLFTAGDLESRRDHEEPEIRRADLAEVVLLLAAADLAIGGTDSALELVDPPPEQALAAATALLGRLGALGPDGSITALGRDMSRLPVHPRLARLVLEACARGAGARGCALAALLQERDIRLDARTAFGSERRPTDEVGRSDGLARLEAFEAASASGLRGGRARSQGLDPRTLSAAKRATANLVRALKQTTPAEGTEDEPDSDEAMLLSILSAFPDRVGARRRHRSAEVVFAGGGSGVLSPRSVVTEDDEVTYLVAAEAAEDRRGRVVIHAASAIEPDWLIELFPDQIVETREVWFNEEQERVEVVDELRYGALVLDRSVDLDVSPSEAAPVLAVAAQQHGVERLFDADALDRFRSRVAFAAAHIHGLEPISDDLVRDALRALCQGRRTFAELRKASLVKAVLSSLDSKVVAELSAIAPETVSIPGRERVPVHYEHGRSPYIESFLQDFFGVEQGPSIVRGEVPLVLHLLAPNRRAVQVTTDLTGFWERHYPALRRSLMRRYTKHSWPEDPLTAQPGALRRRRR